MCYLVYIGTNFSLPTANDNQQELPLVVQNLSEPEEREGLYPKFSKEHIYYIGSFQGCSCGFAFDPKEEWILDDDEEVDHYRKTKDSVDALIDLIKKLTGNEVVEFYCCWDGDWKDPVESRVEIDISEITTENYFGLVEKRFILFPKRDS